MTLTAGAITLTSKTDTTAKLAVSAATGGTGPYTYQWYRSTTQGFTPGGGNILAGKTALTLEDSGLIPGTQYYYSNVVTDTGNSNVTDESTQLGVQTLPPAQSPNAFAQSPQLGMLDLRFNNDTVAAEIDASETGTLHAGQAIKVVDSADGVPKVVACDADSDEVFGFINYDIKSKGFVAGDACEISQAGNVMYLYATGAISRGVQVAIDPATCGGVKAAAGETGATVVGYAFDKAAAAGVLIRVKLTVPSFVQIS